MDPEDHRDSPESSHFIKEASEYLWSSMSREELQRLLMEVEAWDAFAAEAELSRHEVKMLPVALHSLMDKEDRKEVDKKKFLEDFTQLKRDLEKHIKNLRPLAEHMDQVHRRCTISNVVTDSVSVASGVLGILGLLLAPVTGGVSLVSSAIGVGLGAVATVIGVTTMVVEESSWKSDNNEADPLVSSSKKSIEKVSKTLEKISGKRSKDTKDFTEYVKALGKEIRAFKEATAIPPSAGDDTTGGQIPAQDASRVQDESGDTAVATPRRARLRGAALLGVFFAGDMRSLVNESQHLQEGAKSESAEKLWKLIQKMEEKLKELE